MHLVDLIRYRLLTTVESSDFSWMEHGQWQRSLVVRFTMSPNAAGRQQNRTRAGLGSWAALCKSIIVFFSLLVGLLGKYYVTKANVTGASGRIFLDGNGKLHLPARASPTVPPRSCNERRRRRRRIGRRLLVPEVRPRRAGADPPPHRPRSTPIPGKV